MQLAQNGWDASSENHKHQQMSSGNYLKVDSFGETFKNYHFFSRIIFNSQNLNQNG
jgi:hypothetical protein